jgi:hypothetical protein
MSNAHTGPVSLPHPRSAHLLAPGTPRAALPGRGRRGRAARTSRKKLRLAHVDCEAERSLGFIVSPSLCTRLGISERPCR